MGSEIIAAEFRGRMATIPTLAVGTSILTAHIERAFERKKMYLRGVSNADVAVGALLRRSARMTRAIVALGKLGFGADAVALSRSLIDHWIVLRWITNQDSEARARLFWFFEAKQKERVGEVINKYPPSRDPTPLVLLPETQRIADEYPRWDSWGPGVKTMALEEDLLTPEAWVNFPHAWTHETLFFFASCYLHPTAVGLNHEAQQGESLFTFTAKGSSELESSFALSTAASMIAHAGNRASVFWGLGLSEEIAQVWEKRIGRWLRP